MLAFSSRLHSRLRSPLGSTSERPTPPVTAAFSVGVNARTTASSRRWAYRGRMAPRHPPRPPVPCSCPSGCAPTAGTRWRMRNIMPFWRTHWGWGRGRSPPGSVILESYMKWMTVVAVFDGSLLIMEAWLHPAHQEESLAATLETRVSLLWLSVICIDQHAITFWCLMENVIPIVC